MRHSFDTARRPFMPSLATNADDWIAEQTILSDIETATGGESTTESVGIRRKPS
ncbi:MAG: hypothetical protein ACETWE_02785 [Candidatus Bathyarchaeia archaeon]